MLKYIRVSSQTPPRWVTFYPRTVFSPLSRRSVEEIPQEFVNHFRGGFLHDVSQRTRPFPSFSTSRTVPVELGRRRSESRPSVSMVRDFYTSRPAVDARGDSARFLRICEFEGRPYFRRVLVFSPRENCSRTYAHLRSEAIFIIKKIVARIFVSHVTTANKYFDTYVYVHFFNNSQITKRLANCQLRVIVVIISR